MSSAATSKPWKNNFAWLLPAFVMLPIFFAAATLEEANTPNAFQSMATSTILWFPCLAIIAAVSGRFRTIHASIATALFAAYDSFRVREILYEGLEPVVDFSGNPNWITLIVILGGAGALLLSLLWRPTLYRLVVLVACGAQITTLILFHALTVTQPIEVESATEKEFVREIVETTGSLDFLCDIQDRRCLSGDPLELADELDRGLLNPGSLSKLLRDEEMELPVLFTWTESAFASTADEAMRHITVHKIAPDRASVLINERAPTAAFGQMKIAFSVLAGAFQQAWMTIALLILWRHGDYRRRGGRWVRF